MICAWWLLLICPACASAGFVVAAMCAAAARADALARVRAIIKAEIEKN